MNPKLVVGRIVWAELYDPQGRNPKVRPAVLVSPSISETGDAVWLAVAVSTQTDMAPAEVCVELPWHRDGHPRTKLKQRNVAICTWRAFLGSNDILSLGGFTPLSQYNEIMSILNRLMGSV